MYKIKYLPIAQKDLWDITVYILDNLKSPKAAMDFIDTLDKSILRLKQYPYVIPHPKCTTFNKFSAPPLYH